MIKFVTTVQKSVTTKEPIKFWEIPTTLHTFIIRHLKFLKEKLKGSDRDVSAVVLRVFLSPTFPFILLTSNNWRRAITHIYYGKNADFKNI